MARKKIQQPVLPVMETSLDHSCGTCARAIDFCIQGYDGKPVCCRCGRLKTGGFYRFCSHPACEHFEQSDKGLPEVFDRVFKEDATSPAGRVVPLFRGNESKPWMCVPSVDIPCGGIRSDGSPLLKH